MYTGHVLDVKVTKKVKDVDLCMQNHIINTLMWQWWSSSNAAYLTQLHASHTILYSWQYSKRQTRGPRAWCSATNACCFVYCSQYIQNAYLAKKKAFTGPVNLTFNLADTFRIRSNVILASSVSHSWSVQTECQDKLLYVT